MASQNPNDTFPLDAKLDDIEELALCSYCRNPFDDTDRAPKLLVCKHHFCLACLRAVLGERCPYCWKRTEMPPGGAPALPTHAAVLALARRLAPAPARHAASRASLRRDARLLAADLQRLAARRRDFLLRALDAAAAVRARLQAQLGAPAGPLSAGERALLEPDGGGASVAAACAERDRLRARHAAAVRQSRLEELVRGAAGPLDMELVRRALAAMAAGAPPPPPLERADPVLFLANYCTTELFTRSGQAQPVLLVTTPLEPESQGGTSSSSPSGTSVSGSSGASDATAGSPVMQNPPVYPLFYFQLEVNGSPFGRVVIEVHEDVAPLMADNFTMLATGEMGFGYRGCEIFQCWANESVITGDFEHNNGRGGHSAYEENHFMPDDTIMLAARGTVGMRRTQKRHGSQSLVGSQFRIMLQEMRSFTAIFACVVEGLDLVDSISRMGDGSGKPQSTIVISNCGKLN